MYREFILPFDLRAAEEFGRLRVHTCSGPHVFHATLESLPNILATEAGCIAKTAAGYTPVDEAIAAVGDRPIILNIGQELPEGREYEFIRGDFDRYATNKHLLFGYTGMHWRKKDRPLIRDIHRRLNEYWLTKYA